MTTRRHAIVATGAFALTVDAVGTQPAHVPFVVWLGIDPLLPGESEVVEPLREGLRQLGYVEGKSIVFEYRHTHSRPERLPELIEELARQKVDVLFSAAPHTVLVAKKYAPEIPFVFAAIDDPVGAGVIESLSHPGGHATGVSWDSTPAIAAKQFEFLRQVAPASRRLAILWNPTIKSSQAFVREAQSAAEASRTTLTAYEAQAEADFEPAFAEMSKSGESAVLILGSWFSWLHRERLAALAVKQGLPSIFGNRDSVLAGGLMSYGPNLQDLFRRAATYIDKILKGARPADLPVEQPMKFEFVVNAKTAKALGITIPHSLLLHVDELIQ
ncbi:MAG: ABC transporter substrate-binding protein [Proteobacteria bacterium]|nr:ABC transporter substrate-binding protein [Pseudomonadota bacterium]